MGGLRRKGRWLLWSSLIWGLSTAVFGLSEALPPALIVIGLIGLASSWNMSLNRGLIQHQVDEGMRGRIMSIDMMSHGLMPLGVFPISWVAETYGVGTAIWVSGWAFAISITLALLLMPSVRATFVRL